MSTSTGSLKHFLVHGMTAPFRYAAQAQRWIGETVTKIPGWPRIEAIADQVTWPLRATAEVALRRFPILKRAEWLLETERLRNYPPVLLAATIAFTASRGLLPTHLGHIGTDPLIYPVLAMISGLNPFLACFCAVCFAAGDLAQKLLWNDIYGTPQDWVGHYFNLDYWGSIVGYTVAYSSPFLMALVPGMTARVARVAMRQALRAIFFKQAAAAADGATPLRDGWRLFARQRTDGAVEWMAGAQPPDASWIAQSAGITPEEATATLDGIRSGELRLPFSPQEVLSPGTRPQVIQTGQRAADGSEIIGLTNAVSVPPPGPGPMPPPVVRTGQRASDGSEIVGLASSSMSRPPTAPAQTPVAPNYKDPQMQDALRGLRDKGLLNDPDAWRNYRDADGNPLGWRERQILGNLRGRRLLQPGNDAVVDKLLGGQTLPTPAPSGGSGEGPPPIAGLSPYEAADGGPSYPVAEAIASAIGLGFSAAGIGYLASPVLEAPAFDWRPNPDTSCRIMEEQILRKAAPTVGASGGLLGTAGEILAKPTPGGGGAAVAVPPLSQEEQSQQEQVDDLRRRWAQNQHDKDQAAQNIREINEQIARMTPEERARFNDPNSDWGHDIRARLGQNQQQIDDANAAQRWVDEQLAGRSHDGGDSGYGPIHRGGVGTDVGQDLNRQRVEDEDAVLRKKYDEWVNYAQDHSSLTPDGTQRTGAIIDRTNISNPDGTIDKDALDGMIDDLKRERNAAGNVDIGSRESDAAWWDDTVATTTLVRDVGMTVGMGGAGIAGAAIPGAFTAAGAGFNAGVGAITGYSETGSLSGTIGGAAGGVVMGWGMEAGAGWLIGKIPSLAKPLQMGTDAERAWLSGLRGRPPSHGPAPNIGAVAPEGPRPYTDLPRDPLLMPPGRTPAAEGIRGGGHLEEGDGILIKEIFPEWTGSAPGRSTPPSSGGSPTGQRRSSPFGDSVDGAGIGAGGEAGGTKATTETVMGQHPDSPRPLDWKSRNPPTRPEAKPWDKKPTDLWSDAPPRAGQPDHLRQPTAAERAKAPRTEGQEPTVYTDPKNQPAPQKTYDPANLPQDFRAPYQEPGSGLTPNDPGFRRKWNTDPEFRKDFWETHRTPKAPGDPDVLYVDPQGQAHPDMQRPQQPADFAPHPIQPRGKPGDPQQLPFDPNRFDEAMGAAQSGGPPPRPAQGVNPEPGAYNPKDLHDLWPEAKYGPPGYDPRPGLRGSRDPGPHIGQDPGYQWNPKTGRSDPRPWNPEPTGADLGRGPRPAAPDAPPVPEPPSLQTRPSDSSIGDTMPYGGGKGPGADAGWKPGRPVANPDEITWADDPWGNARKPAAAGPDSPPPPDAPPPSGAEPPSPEPPHQTAAKQGEAKAVEGFEHADNPVSVEAINRLRQQVRVKHLRNGETIPLNTVDSIDTMVGKGEAIEVRNKDGKLVDLVFGDGFTPQQKVNLRNKLK